MPSDNRADGVERNTRLEERYEECDICGGMIDAFDAGYYKSANDQTFRHELCHEKGEPPEGYVFELTDTEKCCTNRQYNCGHTIYAPPSEQPEFCPECNGLEYGEDGWSVADSESTNVDRGEGPRTDGGKPAGDVERSVDVDEELEEAVVWTKRELREARRALWDGKSGKAFSAIEAAQDHFETVEEAISDD